MAETERIRERYERRKLLPKDLYSHFRAGHLFILQQRERKVLELLIRYRMNSLEDKRILDVGCGTGAWLRDFLKWGARPGALYGVDLLDDKVEQARELSPHMHTFQANGAELPFLDEMFDLVLQSTVFTSILNGSVKQLVAREMLRVLRKGGLILWYDFRLDNPRNPDVRGIGRREIYHLFPRAHIELQRITLAPPLARRLAPYAWMGCYLLEKIPWLRTHYLGAIQKSE